MNQRNRQELRRLPAVERVLNQAEIVALAGEHGRSVVTGWVREVLGEMRNGKPDDLPADETNMMAAVVRRVAMAASRDAAQRMRRVINGTGIVLHTNLGRAPLARSAIEAIVAAAGGTNLEVDLIAGRRGRRGASV